MKKIEEIFDMRSLLGAARSDKTHQLMSFLKLMTPDLKCELKQNISAIFFPPRPQNASGYQYEKKYFWYLFEGVLERVSV